MTKQDLIHTGTIIVLVYWMIQEQIHALVSGKVFAIIGVVIAAIAGVVYYADIFLKGGEVKPQLPPVAGEPS